MSFASILVLAVGLAMDATAVSATRGLAVPRIEARHVVLVAALFGGAQALLPLLGWFIGDQVGAAVQAWDHWIAFALLAGIGGKMLHEAGETDAAGEGPTGARDPFRLRVLIALAVATSIDAFAAGLTLPMLGAPLLLTVVTIGLVTAVSSVVGLFAGRHFGALIGPRFERLGGGILILLGVQILADHMGWLSLG